MIGLEARIMSTPVRLRDDFRTSRAELREALDGAIESGRPPLGFVLGLVGALVLAFAAVVFYLGHVFDV